MQKRVEATLTRLEKHDPGLRQLLKDAHGYVVFPSVGKAALVVGGAYGHGGVFEKGEMIGYATISQMTLGVQIGGDTFTEILVFHDRKQLERFKRGHMAFAANASAVMVKAAAAGTSDFKGVTALAYSSGGMLLELSLGGQKFTFKPLDAGDEQEGGGKSKGKKRGAQSSREDEGEEADSGSEGAEAGDGMFGRAMGGMVKVTDMAKEHPIAATVLGAGLTTGLAFLLVRAVKGSMGSLGSLTDSDTHEQDDEEADDDTDAQDSADNYEDEDESEEDDEDEPDDDDRGGSRLRRRSRSRA